MFNWSLSSQKKQEEVKKPQFQVTEQMKMSDLPKDIATLFVDTYNLIQENSKDLSTNASNVSSCTIESDFKIIREDTIECITGSLISLAHQIDFGQSSLNECKKDLNTAKSDCANSNQIRGVPSPFIKKYASRITKRAEELSQALASYNSRFQPNRNQLSSFQELSESQVLNNLLVEQQKAILRCSSRVTALNERLERIRSIIKNKLKTSINTNQNEDIQQVLCAQKVQDDYKRYLSDQKQKKIKIAEETDLFGNSTKVAPKKATGFSFNMTKT